MIHFDVPQELIAQEPVHPRDSARLLVYNRQTQAITDTVFSEVDHYLVADSTIVVNNSRVEQCRWLFKDVKSEIFVLDKTDTHTIRAMVRPGRKFKIGSSVRLTPWLVAEVLAIDSDGLRTLHLSVPHDDSRLNDYEHVPLPPYIAQNDELADEYQTVYSKPLGSKAAPTAGLHFTEELIERLQRHHAWLEVTLHVGLGTFAGLSEENFKTGTLHKETFAIKRDVAKQLQSASHITAVGTTSARTLESWALRKAALSHEDGSEIHGETDIFIQPGYEFQRVDSLITNFHLPNTSLLLMVEAFVGDKAVLQKLYNHALAQKYRFYSFGDAMLII